MKAGVTVTVRIIDFLAREPVAFTPWLVSPASSFPDRPSMRGSAAMAGGGCSSAILTYAAYRDWLAEAGRASGIVSV